MPNTASVSIDVANLTQAIDFYVQALSCSLKNTYSDTWAAVSIGSLDLHLLEKQEGTIGASQQQRSFERHWTPVHLDFGVDDVDHAAQLVEAHGGTVEGIEKAEAADIAFCADPFGNGFCLIRESL